MSGRTVDEVRAEIAMLERDLVELTDPTISQALRDLERILPGIEGTLSRHEGSAAEEATLHAVRAFRFRAELAEELHLLEVGMRLRLLPALRNQEHALRQGLAALEPVGPEAVGLFERVVQAARNALFLGHPA